MQLLSNLTPAPKVTAPNQWKPAVEFDGTQGEATTQGFLPDEKPDFDKFLIEAGFDPKEIEIVGEPRTSRWQVARPFPLDPQWLTAYRFRFRKIKAVIDLPLLYAQAKKTKPPVDKKTDSSKVLLVCWSDTQTGKVDQRGGTPELIKRIAEKQAKLEQHLKRNKYQKIVFLNVGDSIEGFDSGGNPIRTNDLSLMQQVDLEATFEWETLKLLRKYAPVDAASIGSNHCAWRSGKLRLGTEQDDWGLHIQRTLARLSKETNLGVRFYEPAPRDESLALDLFGDQSFIVGLVHGHQTSKPESMAQWWRNQSHGDQPVKDADILIHGHWHHLRVVESGRKNGRSRWIVQCPTLDNGSSWYRNTMGGDDSDPGLLIIPIEHNEPFTGTVIKL